MSTLATLNHMHGILTLLGHPVYLGDFLATDDQGLLILPDDPRHYTLNAITTTPDHAWGTVRYSNVRVQLQAWSRTEGEALSMLNSASLALVSNKYVPLNVVNLRRDGDYTGYAQDFERTA